MLLAAAKEDAGDLVECAELLLTLKQENLNSYEYVFFQFDFNSIQ